MDDPQNRTETPARRTDGTFRPGKSGNPGGRPRGIVRRVKELVGEDGGKALEILWEIAQGTLKITQHAALTGAPYEASPGFKDRREALKELLDRGFGKPREPIDLTTKTEGQGLDLSKLTDEQIDQFTALLAAATPDDDGVAGGEGEAEDV